MVPSYFVGIDGWVQVLVSSLQLFSYFQGIFFLSIVWFWYCRCDLLFIFLQEREEAEKRMRELEAERRRESDKRNQFK